MNEFHLFELHDGAFAVERPRTMNDPFSYEPHPLCRMAAEAVRAHVAAIDGWTDEVAQGKMFGVLVCEDAAGQLGFLAAYSGQIGGRSDWPWFVPAVFDYLQPDGYFKQEERRITAINRRLTALERADDLVSARAQRALLQTQAQHEVDCYKATMHAAKARRDAIRSGRAAGPAPDVLIQESQHQKAELRRLKQRWRDRIAEVEAQLAPLEHQLEALRRERHERSDALQRWLFDRFVMLNAQGEGRSLTDIFADTPQGVPPAGSGECCAPKLLQFAYSHGLRPLQIAEFWQGRSPRMEIRHDGQFYTACRGKCLPILRWMLATDERPAHAPQSPAGGQPTAVPPVVYEDADILVIDKPAGLLSVPGRTAAASAEQLLRRRFGDVYMVHRLDMDTSGLMVVARTMAAYHHLQRQFLERTVHKEYIALLDGIVSHGGTVSLPLRPDFNDRPRQLVDPAHGRAATTDYVPIAQRPGGRTLVRLTPHTGRTHQLRVHCAHAAGLSAPIVGDALYGRPSSSRLCLHAALLQFVHPTTGQRLLFQSLPVPF